MVIVYILLSKKDSRKYYIGITIDLQRRIQRHNQSKTRYAKRYAPWELETALAFKNRRLAYAFEKYLKRGSGHAFLKRRLLP